MTDKIAVEFIGGGIYPAKVLSSSALADVALIQLEEKPEKLKVAKLGDSDAAATGDQVFVIGAPYGIEHTLTAGYLSGRRILLEENAVWTGIEILPVTGALAAALNIPRDGALVQGVASGSLGDDLGLRAGYIPARIAGVSLLPGGDVVLLFNGIAIAGGEEAFKVVDALAALDYGQKIEVSALREGKIITLSTKKRRR